MHYTNYGKNSLLIILFVNILNVAHSQDVKFYQIHCVVTESITIHPLPFAAILVLDKQDSSTNIFSITDENGAASFSAPLTGDTCKLAISYMGYQNKVLTVSLSDSRIDLDTILLAPDSVILDEVEIVAPREVIKLQGNKINFNLESVPHLKYMTTDEVIAYLPFMQVDEEVIKMMGNPVLILINNRPHAIYSNVAQLKLLPPHAIERIEVDLVPSARFGNNQKTMNIILKKNYFLGWNGQIRLSASRFSITPMGRISYWSKRYGMDITISDSHQVTYWDTKEEIQNNESNSLITQVEDRQRKTRSANLFASLYYNLDSANLIDMQIGLFKENQTDKKDIIINELSNVENLNTENSSYNDETANEGKSINLSFTHRFRKTGNEFYLLTKYRESGGDQNYLLLTQQVADDPFYTEEYAADNLNKEFTVQIDQQQHGGKKFKYLIGTKLIRRWYNSFNRRQIVEESNAASGTNEESFFIDQIVSSSYFDTEWELFKFKVRAGSRFEYTYQELTNMDTTFFSWVPNISVSRDLSEKHLFSISYYRDLFRPGFSYLIPFVSSQSPNVQISGSNNIPPQFSHQFELQYYVNFEGASLGFNVNHSRVNNFLGEITETNEDGSILIQDTFADLNQDWSFGVSANFRLFKKIRWSHFSSGSYSIQRKDSLKQTLWGGYISEKVYFELPKKQRLSLSLVAFSPNLLIQGKEQGMAYPNTTISYALFVDMAKKFPASLSFSLSNPWLWKGLPSYQEQSGTDFYYLRKSYRANPYVGISINVSLIGKQYGKKNFNRSRSINNNDLNEESN